MKTSLLKLSTIAAVESADGHLAEVVIDMPAPAPTPDPDPTAATCDAAGPGKSGLTCTLPAGHTGAHRCRIVRRGPNRESVEEAEWNDPPPVVEETALTDPVVTDPVVTDPIPAA